MVQESADRGRKPQGAAKIVDLSGESIRREQGRRDLRHCVEHDRATSAACPRGADCCLPRHGRAERAELKKSEDTRSRRRTRIKGDESQEWRRPRRSQGRARRDENPDELRRDGGGSPEAFRTGPLPRDARGLPRCYDSEEANESWRPPPPRANEPRTPDYKAYAAKFDAVCSCRHLSAASGERGWRAISAALSLLQCVRSGPWANTAERVRRANRLLVVRLRGGVLDPARCRRSSGATDAAL